MYVCMSVFEKLLSQKVTAFIEPRLSGNLTAYRKMHSMKTSLIKLTEDRKRAIDDHNIIGILSTNMSKAFDSLHPPLLLRKLDAYGFSTSVKIGTETTSGLFGPLLWNTFQNDLNIFANEQNLMMYADDHQLHSPGQTVKEVQDALNTEGEIISKWYKSNLLKGNYEKYQTMCIGPKDKTKDLEITMSNVKIKCSSDLRLLALTIDQNLDVSKHVGELCKRAGRKVGMITRQCNLLPTWAKLIIYKCPILPQLTNCHTVWNFC